MLSFSFVQFLLCASSSLSLFKCFEINIMVDFCCYLLVSLNCKAGVKRRGFNRHWTLSLSLSLSFFQMRDNSTNNKHVSHLFFVIPCWTTSSVYLSLNHFYFLHIYADCCFSTLFRLYSALVLSTMWLYFLASHILFRFSSFCPGLFVALVNCSFWLLSYSFARFKARCVWVRECVL